MNAFSSISGGRLCASAEASRMTAVGYYFRDIRTPLGDVVMASDGVGLAGLWFAGQKHFGESVAGFKKLSGSPPVFAAAARWIERYFEGDRPDPSELPLCPRGSVFRLEVWEILRGIGYGQTVTYGKINAMLFLRTGRISSARAVGGAVGHNPLSIIIPCHRVVGAGGSLTGYAGGLSIKERLLRHEGVVL